MAAAHEHAIDALNTEVETLRRQNAELESKLHEADATIKVFEERNVGLQARAEEHRADAERFQWWMSNEPKSVDIQEYLLGIRERWTLDQWRAYVDRHRNKG